MWTRRLWPGLVLTAAQTALDYAEPSQRALLVEGIRPVLPLIRNTPYGKRIQNKLQREQMDPFGGFSSQQTLVNIALSNQGMAAAPGNRLGTSATWSQCSSFNEQFKATHEDRWSGSAPGSCTQVPSALAGR